MPFIPAAASCGVLRLKIKPMDALHLACAERSADVMLTTDDEILRAAIRMSADIKVIVMNPARWLLDVF